MNAIVTLNLYGTEAVIYDTVLGSLAQEVHYFGSPPYDYCTGIPDIFRSILIARFPFPVALLALFSLAKNLVFTFLTHPSTQNPFSV